MARYTGDLLTLQIADTDLDAINDELTRYQHSMYNRIEERRRAKGIDIDRYISDRLRHIGRVNELRQILEDALYRRRQELAT